MNRPRVVIADDHPANAALLTELLQVEFDVVAHVPDGAALVDAVAALSPDVVVSDISMPSPTGVVEKSAIAIGAAPSDGVRVLKTNGKGRRPHRTVPGGASETGCHPGGAPASRSRPGSTEATSQIACSLPAPCRARA